MTIGRSPSSTRFQSSTVDDFSRSHVRTMAAGVEFVTLTRTEPYGRAAVFLDIAGNRWT